MQSMIGLCAVDETLNRAVFSDVMLLPSRPQSAQHHPEEFIWSRKLQSPMPLPHNPKLLSKGKVFQEQVTARAEYAGKQERQKTEKTNLETSFAPFKACWAFSPSS
jgi:hypothetical protein